MLGELPCLSNLYSLSPHVHACRASCSHSLAPGKSWCRASLLSQKNMPSLNVPEWAMEPVCSAFPTTGGW